jgi:carbamoyl-phosphate synthase large subunit
MPPLKLDPVVLDNLRKATHELARALEVQGLLNIQYAIKDRNIYVLEVNPRASRTVPYVSKTIGISLAKLAAKVMVGRKLNELGFARERSFDHISIKESVLPFIKFPKVDILLGPEMKSTGEVIGLDRSYGISYAKAQMSAGNSLPTEGAVAVSLSDRDKDNLLPSVNKLAELGFEIIATGGTHKYLKQQGVASRRVYKVGEGSPNIVDLIEDKEVNLLINTPSDEKSQYDAAAMRRAALMNGIPYVTTKAGAIAAVEGIEALRKGEIEVTSLQEYYV